MIGLGWIRLEISRRLEQIFRNPNVTYSTQTWKFRLQNFEAQYRIGQMASVVSRRFSLVRNPSPDFD
ncbi:hypothetical protein TNCT_240751 [Trichonephila clavata]|uniref:Uncharacterized protein n=1 Tax=Trichonephila clavata TaxID=2740835 RepID=A0A8X6J0E4_TRICU|nr:hypothetical protein TNCT_240751 [Trichonephila clavata]